MKCKMGLIIIVPCYNEANRLPIPDFLKFLEGNKTTSLVMVDDYSTDGTEQLLLSLQKRHPKRISIVNNPKNLGKAGAIRAGVKHIIKNGNTDYLAYLDADLATSLEECASYSQFLNQGKQFVFASRILKIGSIVERKFSRFFFGRIIATCISYVLDLKVYDTQCGCKVFTSEIAKVAFKEPFISRWLFDVEIFSRIIKKYGKERAIAIMDEIPVKKWVDKGKSKVRLTYFFSLWIDLYKIWKFHKS